MPRRGRRGGPAPRADLPTGHRSKHRQARLTRHLRRGFPPSGGLRLSAPRPTVLMKQEGGAVRGRLCPIAWGLLRADCPELTACTAACAASRGPAGVSGPLPAALSSWTQGLGYATCCRSSKWESLVSQGRLRPGFSGPDGRAVGMLDSFTMW